jgi:hypothetical protein
MADVSVLRRDFRQLPMVTLDIISRAQKEVLIVTRSFTWVGDDVVKVLSKLKERGVEIRIIGRFGEEGKAAIRHLLDDDIPVRLHEFAGENTFMIIDGQELHFAIREPLKPTVRYYIGIRIDDVSSAAAMKTYVFEEIWREAEEASYRL